ncbi:hypothetical protein [Microseira wollei]|uniref:Pentapeptide repeat protein n=1 Tax=Microseira wollei NIES-4236 TaxID=2530354 RepID=A0AAV3XNV0_9CYAN|nr:hypothetical protein [Microseira wollei]GET44612.1 pentapeptide repeat protein [Microseira wollei NIES-4236]
MNYPITAFRKDEIKDGVYMETNCSLHESGVVTGLTRSWTNNNMQGAHSRMTIFLLDANKTRLKKMDEVACGVCGKWEELIRPIDKEARSDRSVSFSFQVPQALFPQVKYLEIVHYERSKSLPDYLEYLHLPEQLAVKDEQLTQYQEILKIMAKREPTNKTTIHATSIGFVQSGSGTVSNFSQNIGQNIDQIAKLINSLREMTQEFPETQREEALVHLDDLQDDISQPDKRTPPRIKTRIIGLWAVACTVAGLVAGAADFSNRHLQKLSKPL